MISKTMKEINDGRDDERQESRLRSRQRDRRLASLLVGARRRRRRQRVIDFVFWMHFIKPVYVIEPFEIDRAAILVVVTAVLGFVVGSVFAMIWNAAHKA